MDWYKRYPADFMVGTAHMTTEEVGAYQLLLDAQWDRGGRLPACERKLARIARLSLRKFRSAWSDALAEKFEQDEDGYFNPRLDNERRAAIEIVKKRRSAGRLGGLANAQANAKQKGKQTSEQTRDTRASLSLISLISEIKEEGDDADCLRAEPFPKTWEAWIAHRKEHRWSVKPTWAKRQLKKLAQYGARAAARALEESMAQGWQGTFPEKIGPVGETSRATGPRIPCPECDWVGPQDYLASHLEIVHGLTAQTGTGA